MLLTCEDLVMKFGGLTAIDHLSFHVEQGEIVGLIGPNGSGKTTVFNVISGIYRPTAGRIVFAGQDITGYKPSTVTRCGIARTFQNIRLFGAMTVWENVLIGRHCRLTESVWDDMFHTRRQAAQERLARERLEELLALFHMSQYKRELAKNLPYGLQRKLEIVRALATEPQLLLLDEPAAGMNPQETAELRQFIALLRELGITTVLVEHDMKLVMNLCNRIIVLCYGKAIAQGQPGEIQNNAAVIAAYLGQKGERSA